VDSPLADIVDETRRIIEQSRDIRNFFSEMGYTPRQAFNAMSGKVRLIFNDIERGRRVDIFLNVFEMSHKFDFRNRLTLDKPTISLADLLATKLQVVEITEREYTDIIALMCDHEVGDTNAPEIINGSYLAHLCADDWGIYKTFTINITQVRDALPHFELDTEYQEVVRKRLNDLQSRIENIPKTIGWRMRAKIGEKKRWYELPERHGSHRFVAQKDVIKIQRKKNTVTAHALKPAMNFSWALKES